MKERLVTKNVEKELRKKRIERQGEAFGNLLLIFSELEGLMKMTKSECLHAYYNRSLRYNQHVINNAVGDANMNLFHDTYRFGINKSDKKLYLKYNHIEEPFETMDEEEMVENRYQHDSLYLFKMIMFIGYPHLIGDEFQNRFHQEISIYFPKGIPEDMTTEDKIHIFYGPKIKKFASLIDKYTYEALRQRIEILFERTKELNESAPERLPRDRESSVGQVYNLDLMISLEAILNKLLEENKPDSLPSVMEKGEMLFERNLQLFPIAVTAILTATMMTYIPPLLEQDSVQYLKNGGHNISTELQLLAEKTVDFEYRNSNGLFEIRLTNRGQDISREDIITIVKKLDEMGILAVETELHMKITMIQSENNLEYFDAMAEVIHAELETNNPVYISTRVYHQKPHER